VTDLKLLPNVEAMVSTFLQEHPSIVALAEDAYFPGHSRTYTVIPKDPTWPLLRVAQYDDEPAGQRPLHHVAYFLQIDGFGGTKAQAWTLASTARAALAADLPGTHADGVVTGVDTRGLSDAPDDTYSPAKPRWMFTAVVYAHPLRSTPAS
jgi:hypothetical protein